MSMVHSLHLNGNSNGTIRGRGRSLSESIRTDEVHARVELRDLVAVSVKHLRFDDLGIEQAALAQPLLFFLAKAGMLAVGIDVGEEAIGRRPTLVPGGGRLL